MIAIIWTQRFSQLRILLAINKVESVTISNPSYRIPTQSVGDSLMATVPRAEYDGHIVSARVLLPLREQISEEALNTVVDH